MATPVIMPRQGQSVETCIITSWLKRKGDKVTIGELLFSYETDKAAFDMEAPADGTLLETFFGEGDEVPVLTNVAVIGTPGDDVELFRPSPAGKPVPVIEKTPEIKIVAGAPAAIDEISGGKAKISPRARKMAEERGIRIDMIAGTGPGGRIVVEDIENAISGKPGPAQGKMPAAGFTDKPLTNVRKLISKAMHSSLQNSAQLTHHMSADVRRLLDARKKVKDDLNSGKQVLDITLNDMICWCVVRALLKHPGMNCHLLGEMIRSFTGVNLGFAVDTSRGLMVPVVRNAEKLDLHSLSAEMKNLSDSCRKGSIDPELLKSTAASFTVSNLGSYGVEMFTPVINLPQAGILGVCTVTHRPADTGGGVFGFIPVIGLSLTYDHRAVDGGPATLFLKEIKNNIEHFNIN